MSTYTRKEVDAEIHKVLKSTQEMFEGFAESDEIGSARYIARQEFPQHAEWLKGRAVAYRLVADHMDRLKEGYE
jgi:hypothetical protein